MISWDRINELKGEVGEDDFAEVVEIFLEEMDEAMNELTSGVSKEGLGAAMHFVKGAAMNIGFHALGNICQEYETLSGEGKDDLIDCRKVVECYRISKTEFTENAPKIAA